MKKKELIISILMISLSSIVQIYIIQSMIEPEHLVSMGFTGLSMLASRLLTRVGINISLSFFLAALNIPVAILCAKKISPKFTFLSLLQIFITSTGLKIFSFKPVFDSPLLVITIGGFIYGISTVLALKSGGSTGGTDFIALYVSNKINKSIWEEVFIFNAIILMIQGYMYGWENAGYSLIFQYVTTRTISAFYNRYSRVTLQIITKYPDEVISKYTSSFMHGITKLKAEGGYSKTEIYLLYTVVSSYEQVDVVKLVKSVDKNVLINVLKTEEFYGSFHIKPI